VLHEVEGDLLLSGAQAIAHGVAPNDDFHVGLALSLRERWPAMYKDFRHYCQTAHPKPGDAWTWAGADAPRIVNLFTQEGVQGHHGGKPGRAHLNYVNKSLRELRHIAENRPAPSGHGRRRTGLGGGQAADRTSPRRSDYPRHRLFRLSQGRSGRRTQSLIASTGRVGTAPPPLATQHKRRRCRRLRPECLDSPRTMLL
jgi:O-acetyl-ADP-ribose deacetylase (regulator of RNase III)